MNPKLVALFLFSFFAGHACAFSSPCSIPQPRLRVNRADIFSDQQEQWLGDAQADMVEPRYILLPADQSQYLDELGQRLLRQLPPTPIHYTFRIFESPYLRAFSLAGGHVYISRKLIMDAQSEDELAAMLAQEIGRIYIHHAASAVTRFMESTMDVKHLSDRADVENKLERMLNMPSDEYAYLSFDEQRDDDVLADRVGLYAMIQARFNPRVFPEFLDRINDNGGYTGNFLTDLFELTPIISERVRMAKKVVASLPKGCNPDYHSDAQAFQRFQQAIGEQRIDPFVAPTPGLESVALQPIAPVLKRVMLSPNGKYALAQDGFQIHVLSTNPAKVLFSIDAFQAEKAQFTPDSQSVVFHYNDMHVEKWKIATGQPTSVQDFVDYAGCLQTSLSPDGTAMACVSPYFTLTGKTVWLKLADIVNGKMLYQKHDFFDNFSNTPIQATMRWSRDGRYFVATSGLAAMSYDLTKKQTVHLDGVLGDLRQQRFVFVGSKMLSTCDWSFINGARNQLFQMCYTTFPDGQKLSQFQLPYGGLRSVADSNHLLFGPLAHSAAALIDPTSEKIQVEFPDSAVDLLGTKVAYELPSGGVGIGSLHGEIGKVALPQNPLTAVETSVFSPDGHYVTVSNPARAAVWDSISGARLAVRQPFYTATIDNNGDLHANTTDHEITRTSNPFLYPLQVGDVALSFVPTDVYQDYGQFVRLDVQDVKTHAKLWSKTFIQGAPQFVAVDADYSLLVTSFKGWSGNGKLTYTSDQRKMAHIYPFGTVVAVISNRTGKIEHQLFSPQLTAPDCLCEYHSADLFGTMLAVYGIHNETTVYQVATGERLFAFFGRALAGDNSLSLLASTDRLQQLNIYDAASGRRVAHYMLDQAVIAAHFVPDRQELLALTASQHLYRIHLASLLSRQPTESAGKERSASHPR